MCNRQYLLYNPGQANPKKHYNILKLFHNFNYNSFFFFLIPRDFQTVEVATISNIKVRVITFDYYTL